MDGNTKAAVEFLQKWCPDGPWVLTSIIPNGGKTTTETFDDPHLASIWIEEKQGHQNIYFTVNPTKTELKSKAKKTDIQHMAWLHVDIDPRPGERIDTERKRALASLKGFDPKPTVIVDSGGGYQGFWKLEEPIEFGSNPFEAEAYNQQIEILLGGDHCHNVDRIMRLPGTVNVPSEKKRKAGRTEALAAVVEEHWDRVYPITKFTPAANVQTDSHSGSERVKISGNLAPVELEDLPAAVSQRTKMLIVQACDPDDPTKYESRSEVLFAVCCELVRGGCEADTIASVIMDPGYAISESVLDKPRPEKYAARQIERAMEEAIDPWLRKLNEMYAVIGVDSGATRIIREVMDPALDRPTLVRLTFTDFRNLYMNQLITLGHSEKGHPIQKPVGKWWLEHPMRRQYDFIAFAPGKEIPNTYNMWKGFSCEALPGTKHQAYLDHIKENVCGGNQEYFEYVVQWMARAIQKPDCQGETAIVLRGKRGTGKSFFVKMFGSLFGRHFLQVADSKHLVGSFNEHLRDCVLLFGDEAFFAGDKKHESVLKTLITEDTLSIEGKGKDLITSPNYTHLILASNDNWVVPAGAEERRFLVLDVGDKHMQDANYFKSIAQDMSNGGRENLLHFLMNIDLNQFEVRNVPKTAALQEQKQLSMSIEEQWWFDKLQAAQLTFQSDFWPAEVQKDFLYEDYVEYAKNAGWNRRLTPAALGRTVSKFCPPQLRSIQKMGEKRQPDGTLKRGRSYFYVMPPLDACREYFDEQFGGPYVWEKVSGEQEEIQEECPF